MGVQEIGERLARYEHHDYGDHDRSHHHVELVDHADSRNDRVQREHRIKYNDLHYHRPKSGMDRGARLLVRCSLDPIVNLYGRLDEQEYAAQNEYDVATGNLQREYGKQRCSQRHDP
jgi:hypothetical protein